MNRYKTVILVLENERRAALYPPESAFYLGEAYRRRGESEDGERAERAYQRALVQSPQFAPTYRALGTLYMKRGDHQRAAEMFARYLALAPQAPDRAYVAQYYETVRKELQAK